MSPEEDMLMRLHIPQLCEFLGKPTFARSVSGTKVCWSRRNGFYVAPLGRGLGLNSADGNQALVLRYMYRDLHDMVDLQLMNRHLPELRERHGIPARLEGIR